MATTDTHSARSLDEHIVAYLEYDEGCVKTTDGVIPPPASCSDTVHAVYALASWHLFSITVAVLFMGMMLSFTLGVLSKGDHH